MQDLFQSLTNSAPYSIGCLNSMIWYSENTYRLAVEHPLPKLFVLSFTKPPELTMPGA